jgi:diguanylate cyclase (GGDEF)-like protein/PAS domain S-box-containing protein
MRVIAGNGAGDNRSDVEARLLKLAAQCAASPANHDVLPDAVSGIAGILDAACMAIEISPVDGSLSVVAQSEENAAFAAHVNALHLPLAADALVSAAVMGATWAVQRDGGDELRSELLAAHPEHASFSASAAIPITAAEGTYGVFVLYALRERAFSARHLDAVRAVGTVVGAVLDRRKQGTAEIARWEKERVLLESIADLDGDLREPIVLQKAAEYLLRATAAPLAIVWRLEGNRFTPRTTVGDEASAGFAKSLVANADANMPIGGGPLGRTARSGEISYVKDALADRSFAPWVDIARSYSIRSVLAVPLLADVRATIVLELYSRDVDAFADEAVAAVRRFLPHLQVALRNALDEDALRLLARDRALATSAASGISRSLDEADVARSIARATVEALGASFTIVYVASGGSLSVAGGWNNPADLSAKLNANAADPAFALYPPVQAMREGRYVVRSNVTSDSAWIRLGWEQIAREHAFNAVGAFPLLDDNKPLGAVAAFFAQQAPALEPDDAIMRQLGVAGGAAIAAARTYDEAKAARNFLDRILEESNDAIVQFDLQGAIVAWNRGAERIFRMSRAEALGRLFYELPIIPPDRREDIRELLSRVSRGEQVHVFEVECRNREGGRMEVLLSASPARDQQGKIVGLVAFSKDISEQRKQFEQLQRQNRNLVVMRDVIRSLSREVGFAAIGNKGLEKLLEVLNLDVGRLYLYDPAEGMLQNVAQRGFLAEGADSVVVMANGSAAEGPLAEAVVYRQTMLTVDGTEQRLEHPHFAQHARDEVSMVLTKPLTLGEEVIGVVQVIAFDERRISPDDQSILHAVADELAVALRHARLLEESSRLAVTDPLTGLHNYRFTQDVLRKRLSEARRRKRPLSIVMVDVDGLQTINERYGREFGDTILRHFAGTLLSSVRISDVVARYGGDEFIVLLPETQLSDAVMLAERMAARIAETDWPTPDGELTVTASLGVASYPEVASQMQMLLKAADSALYRAKQAGRNAVYPRIDSLPRFAG